MCEDVSCALYLYVQLCCVLGLCKDAYILWFAKVFSGLEPHPKQGPTVRTSLPSLYFDFQNRFLTLLEIVGGTPLTLSPYFNKKKGKKNRDIHHLLNKHRSRAVGTI